MNHEQLFKIFIYVMIDLLPNILLALIAFQHSLRLSKRFIFLLALPVYFILVASRASALQNISLATAFTIIWVVLYLILYRVSIKTSVTKLLFVLLIILNYNSAVTIIYSYVSFHLLNRSAEQPYTYQMSLIYAVTLLLTYPFILYLIVKKIRPLMDCPENSNVWRLLWLIPATFCLSYYYNLYANGGIVAFSEKINNVLFAVLFQVGAFLTTYVVVHLVEESNSYVQLKTEHFHLSLQSLQYENLKNLMEESRRARHDLRQNLTLIQSYVKDSDYDGLKEFLKRYMDILPLDSTIMYSENYALNALIVYYEELARTHDIPFSASIQFSNDRMIADTDLVVLFGNLLENALQACLRQRSGKHFISLQIQTKGAAVITTLDNSYDGELKMTEQRFQSSKGSHAGIGISSIQKIVVKYNGVVKFEYDAHSFHTSLLFYA